MKHSSVKYFSLLIIVTLSLIGFANINTAKAKSPFWQTFVLPHLTTKKTNSFPKPENVKGIYLTATTYAGARRDEVLNKLLESGGNAVTIDAEISGGRLAFLPKTEQLRALNPGKDILNLKEMVEDLHGRGVYVIMRLVVFNDPYMAQQKPDWRIKTNWGSIWGGMGWKWLDPSKPGAQNYNLMVISELSQAGVDEIQLDYIRFPTTQLGSLNFHYDEVKFSRSDVINDFLRKANTITKMYDVKLGADVFGASVWGNVDYKILGQHIPTMSNYLDAIYPMTYPSHFSNGYYGYYNIYGNPYPIIHDSIEKFVQQASESDTETEVRTYVQGFASKIPRYGSWFMNDQVTATFDAGGKGFMIWNARNSYSYSWPSLSLEPQKKEVVSETTSD